jgi:MFS superfamily sulfate permease-like transporter
MNEVLVAVLVGVTAPLVGVLIGFAISLALQEYRHRRHMKQLDEEYRQAEERMQATIRKNEQERNAH